MIARFFLSGALVALTLPALAATPGGELVASPDLPPPTLADDTSLFTWLAVLPIMLPFLGAALTLTLRGLPRWQAPVALVSLGLALLSAIALMRAVEATGPMVMAAGNWMPPFGIVIAVDSLGALLVLVTCLTGFVGLAYARADVGEEGVSHGFYTFWCLMIAGVCGAFSTGDIFNLYVWFEVFLISSFGLIVFGGERVQMDGAIKYGFLNLIATTLFLITVGALYGITGTLNMADIRGVLAATEDGPVATLAALFVVAFAMKAAAFPLHYWLPASYPTPKIVVAAIFAGLLTKVGVYSLLRVLVMLFGEDGTAFLPIVGWMGVLTAVLGACGALAQTDMRRMASFLVISGVGIMLIGFGVGGAEGLTGTIVYAVHSIFVMTALFLVVGVVERLAGRSGLWAGGNLYATHTLVAGLFLVFGFSAAGLPPFSGFWPKLILIEAALSAGGPTAVAGAVGVILSGILTTIVIGRAWALVFLRPRGEGAPAAAERPSAALMVPLAVLAVVVVGLGIFPGIAVAPAQVGAAGLIDPASYVERVLGLE